MKRTTDQTSNIDNILSTEVLEKEDTQKRKKIKIDAFVKFSSYYYEFKKLLSLFSTFGETIKIRCSNTNVTFAMTDNFVTNIMPKKSLFRENIDKIVFNNRYYHDQYDKLDKHESHSDNSNNHLNMFALFEKKDLKDFTTNLTDTELYETSVFTKNILDAFNSLNFSTNSFFVIELYFSNNNPHMKITKQISSDELFSTSFEEIKMNTTTKFVKSIPLIDQTGKTDQIKQHSSYTQHKQSDESVKTNQSMFIDFNTLLFSAIIKTKKLLDIVGTVEKSVNHTNICCTSTEVKFKWQSKTGAIVKDYEYILKSGNDICNTVCKSNPTESTKLQKFVEKNFNLVNFHNILRFSVLFSTNTTLHFFLDSKFMITSLIGTVGKLFVNID